MAQKKKDIDYYVIPQLALLNGDHAASGQVQVVGGIEKKHWNFGLGMAVDYYKMRTLPVFADLRNYFGRQHRLFAYGNLGYNIVQPLVSEKRYNSDYSNGLYTDLGIGYAIHGQKRRTGMLLSLGYSLKTFSERYTAGWWDVSPIIGFPQPVRVDSYRKADYTLSCFSLKLGVRL